MDKINIKYNNIKIYTSLLFIIGITFLIFPSGFYMGGDWTVPQSRSELDIFSGLNGWNSNSNFGSPSIEALSSYHFRIFYKLLYLIGIGLDNITKFIIVIFYGISALYLLKIQNEIIINSNITSFFITLFFLFSPIAFNYITMGWIYVVISYLLMPIFFYYSYKLNYEEKDYSLILAFILWIAAVQIQSIGWYLIITMTLVLFSSSSIKYRLLNLKIYLYVLILNIPWILSYLYSIHSYQDFKINSIVTSTESIGSDSVYRLTLGIVGLGANYNQSYEIWLREIYGKYAYFIYIELLLILFCIRDLFKNLLFKKIFICAISLLIGISLSIEYRSYLVYIPGSGIFRQLSRFLVVYFFFFSLVLSYSVNNLYLNKLSFKFLLLPLLFSLTAFSLSPWFLKLVNTNKQDTAISIIIHSYPDEYKYVNDLLANKENYRALYLPTGVMQKYNDNVNFFGTYKTFIDTNSAFSNMKGGISIATSRLNPSAVISYRYVNDSRPGIDFYANDKLIDYYIFRINMAGLESESKILNNFPKNLFKIIYHGNDIILIERINKNFIIDSEPKNKIITKRISNSLWTLEIDPSVSKINFKESYSNDWSLCPQMLTNNNYIINSIYGLIKNKCQKSNYYDYDNKFGNTFDLKNSGYSNFYLVYLPEIIYILISLLLLLIIFLYGIIKLWRR